MEIGSLGGLPPQDPNRKVGGTGSPRKKGESELTQDSFSGPSTGELKKKLESMDGNREDKIDKIKNALSNNAYLTEERIQGLVDQLISKL
jgi:hypothetical protein